MLNIAVLCSGGGTNLAALIKAQEEGIIKSGKIKLVVGSREGIYALERAKNASIPSVVIKKDDVRLANYLNENGIDIVVLAGYLSIFGEEFFKIYKGKIINVHPALIPSFCGKGYYGLHVHEKVLEYGVKVTGATVHFVNEVCDGGEIILQKCVSVMDDDTPETLQLRVMEEAEHIILPQAVEICASGNYKIIGRKVVLNV